MLINHFLHINKEQESFLGIKKLDGYKIITKELEDVYSGLYIHLVGRIDFNNYMSFEVFLDELEKHPYQNIVVDIKGLTHTNSCLVGSFIKLHKRIMKDGKLVFINIEDNVKEVFDLIGLTQYLVFKKSMDDAIKYIKA
jgi:anti-anti-sigma factor